MTSHPGELYRGERVLWTGSPRRFPFFARRDIVRIPLGIAIGVVPAVVWWRLPIPEDPVVTGLGWVYIAVAVAVGVAGMGMLGGTAAADAQAAGSWYTSHSSWNDPQDSGGVSFYEGACKYVGGARPSTSRATSRPTANG